MDDLYRGNRARGIHFPLSRAGRHFFIFSLSRSTLMRQDQRLVTAVGVCVGVALLPFALHFIHSWLRSAEDNEDRTRDDQDSNDEDVSNGVVMEVVQAVDHAQDEDHDLNDTHFFALWLDPHMLLSSARFHGVDDDDVDLTLAQRRMLNNIATTLGLQEGMRVLEIECGWGGAALYLARVYGVVVTGYSHYEARVTAARLEVEADGVAPHTVAFVHGDVTEESGTFDRIIRIALLKHESLVPEELYWNLLVDGGKALVHRGTSILDRPAAEGTIRFDIASEDISDSFAETVCCWSENLRAQELQGALQGFEANTRAWQARLALLSTELDIGVRGLEQVVYSKPLPTAHVDHAATCGEVRRRDGRAMAHSRSAPAAM